MKPWLHALVSASIFLLFSCAAPPPPAPSPISAGVRVGDLEVRYDPAEPLATLDQIQSAQNTPLPEDWRAWNNPYPPFNVIGNIYYIGVEGVSSWLITSQEGDILLDGALPQSAPLIEANIAALGFDIHDVKIVLNSHAHIDHQGGLAALQRASGAIFIASAADKPTLESGHIDFGPTAGMQSPPIRVDRVIGDGETVTVGDVTMTAHLTPGHTPGCTSWSMPVTGADGAQHTAFFHCSSTVAGQSLVPESYPGMVADYRATFAKVRTLSADVFLANHASFFGRDEKRARQLAGDANAFVDPGALQAFNAQMEAAFNAELARQQAAAH